MAYIFKCYPYYFKVICVCGMGCTFACSTHEGQKRALDHLDLQLLVYVSAWRQC